MSPHRNAPGEVHLIKAAQATPFVETLTRLGAPVEILARHAGLPLDAVRRREGVIGERSLWRLLEQVARLDGFELLGYKTALDHPVTSAAQLGGLSIRQASTLERMLELFIHDVRGESSGASYSLRSDGDRIWFRRRPIFRESDASWIAEQYVLSFIIQIVRLCAEPDWLPSEIRASSLDSAGPVPPEWAPIRIRWGHDATELAIDRATLDLPPRPIGGADGRTDSADPSRAKMMKIDDLVDRQIWSGETGLDNAAYELGFSSTTFKRRLASQETSYSEIVERRTYRLARRLLADSELPIAGIARGLGYSHPSSFTRAFLRMSGVSPRAYRKGARSIQPPASSNTAG